MFACVAVARTIPTRIRYLVAALATALAVIAAAPASTALATSDVTPEQRASALARPAVVYLEVHWTGWVRDPSDGRYFNDGDPIELVGACTGFNVNPDGYLVTAGHCVDPGPEGVSGMFISAVVDHLIAAGVRASHEDLYQLGLSQWVVEGQTAGSQPDRQLFAQWGVAASGLTTGKALPARVVDFRPVSQGDAALVKVEQSNLPSLEVAPGSDVEIGSHMLAVGYPASAEAVSDQTLEPTNKDGTVSAKRTDGGVPVYEVSAAATAGMSGGPAVNTDGKVIGLVSRGPAGESQAFNFITPSNTVREMLSRNGVENRLGPVDTAYRNGLDLFFAGRYRAATAQFEQALALLPSHQQAQEYKQRAAEAIAAGKDQPVAPPAPAAAPVQRPLSDSSALAVVVVALAVALGGGTGAVFIIRRRTAGRAATSEPAAGTADPAGMATVSHDPSGIPTGAMRAGWLVHDNGDRQLMAKPSSVVVADGGRFCGRCGTDRQPGASYCSSCGASLS